MIEKLTPTMVRDLLELLRAWRAGRLAPRPERSRGVGGPRQSAYGRLYEVTAVNGETGMCTVQRPYADEQLDPSSELAGVIPPPGAAPSVGDRGEVLRLAQGELYFHPGGAGAPGADVTMAKAHPGAGGPSAPMTQDGVLYDVYRLKKDGTSGGGAQAYRPPGHTVLDGTLGMLIQDADDQPVFMPFGAGLLAQTTQAMEADGVLYDCRCVSQTGGVVGTSFQAYRPPGIVVPASSYGFVTRTLAGLLVFMPANLRPVPQLPLALESRTDDYNGADPRIWLRSDL